MSVNRNMAGKFDTIFIRDEAIETLENQNVLADLATPGILPKHNGSVLRFQIDENPAYDDTSGAGDGLRHSLTASATGGGITNVGGTEPYWPADAKEGITWATRGDFNRMTWASQEIDNQIQSYGGFVPVRNVDLDDMPKSTMQRLGNRLGYVAIETMDSLCRMTLDGTTAADVIPDMGSGSDNIFKSIGDGSNDAVISADDKLTAEDIGLATGMLWNKNVSPFSNGFYAGIFHSVAVTHLVTDASDARITWEKMNRYVSGFSGQEKLTKGHTGAILGTMIIRVNSVSINAATVPGASDAENYMNMIIGKDAFGNIHRDQLAPEIIINRPDAASTDNPFRIYGTAAFYFQCRPTLLDPNRMVKVLSATGN